MQYADMRHKIKSGDLIALTHKEWDSLHDLQVQVVRIGTRSEYCHICVAWVVLDRVFVIESVTPLVRLLPLSNLQDSGFYWCPVGADYPMTEAELRLGLKWVGRGQYSKWDAIQGQLGTLAVGEDDKFMCAELTLLMRGLSGLDLAGTDHKITPSSEIEQAQMKGYPVFLVLNDKDDEGT